MPNRQRKKPDPKKNAAAVALGRLGGLARGRTVMQNVPASKRSMYARHAATARWAAYRAEKKAQEDNKKT